MMAGITVPPRVGQSGNLNNRENIMNDNKHYYTELHAKGFKHTDKFSGFDSCCAHFSTRAKVGTITFERAKMDAVDYYWNQQKRGWTDYTVGKTFAQTGHKDVSVMCPSYSEGHRSNPVFEEVSYPVSEKVKDEITFQPPVWGDEWGYLIINGDVWGILKWEGFDDFGGSFETLTVYRKQQKMEVYSLDEGQTFTLEMEDKTSE